jgi:predicted dehydrogenase
MSTKKMRLGLVGCGPRGKEHIRAALATGQFELRAIADLDAARLNEFAKLYPPQIHYTDFKAMLNSESGSIDVLHVCTQPTLRSPVIKAAIEAGVKAIVVEKPMALDFSEASALQSICAAAKVLLVVNHQKRNMVEWVALREAVSAGQLGQVTMLRSNCFGNLLDQGTHMLDMAWNVLGEPQPQWVLGACDSRGNEVATHPAPRNSLALVEFSGGIRGSFAIGEDTPVYPRSRSPWFHCNIEVFGTDGKAEAVLDQGFRRWDRNQQLVETLESRWDEKFQGAGQERISADVARALREPAFKHPQRGEAALVGFSLMEAICRSALAGKVIELPLTPGEDALARWCGCRWKRARRCWCNCPGGAMEGSRG